jgi:hypothetical protein
MTIRHIATTLYVLVGAIVLASGVVIALMPTGIWPAGLEQVVLEFANGDPLAMHLTQEMGATFVFVGLITFWFVRHYEQSMPFHWAMTVFFGLFGLAHVATMTGTWRLDMRSLGDMVPFVLFVVVGLLRRQASARG